MRMIAARRNGAPLRECPEVALQATEALRRPEPPGGRETARRQLARPCPPAEPVAPVGPGAAATVRGGPGGALSLGEDQAVAQAAFAVALQLDALAARHFRQLGEREDQRFAVVADDRQMIAVGWEAEAGPGGVHRQHLLAGPSHRHRLVLRSHEAIP